LYTSGRNIISFEDTFSKRESVYIDYVCLDWLCVFRLIMCV
jgi:hypothetical protein